MRAHIVSEGVVVNTIVLDSLDEVPGALDADALGGGIGWLWDGETLKPPAPPPKAPEEIRAEIVAQTQARLDAFAQTRGYDGILSCATYATSTVPKFAAEGQYAVEARDATWSALYAMLDEVLAGTRPLPAGYADVEPELPPLAWPA